MKMGFGVFFITEVMVIKSQWCQKELHLLLCGQGVASVSPSLYCTLWQQPEFGFSFISLYLPS